MSGKRTIPVTQPTLPALDEYLPLLEEIWRTRQLTNGGPLHERLEAELAAYLGVAHISLYNNGTIALIAALNSIEARGRQVITTPFTFVATAHAIAWAGFEPVFVDVDPDTCNLDPNQVEAVVGADTAAILPVHCYGTPCDVDAFGALSRRHGIPVIYDAAHAFAVRYRDESLMTHGDLAVLSFHATKVFNTVEGGAVVCRDAETKAWLDRFRNFGLDSSGAASGRGLNGKLNELQAALGLTQLPDVDDSIARRRDADKHYREQLQDVGRVTVLSAPEHTAGNYAYFPVLVQDGGAARDQLLAALIADGVHARKYFHPLVCDMTPFAQCSRGELTVARALADRILCLPIYDGISTDDIQRACAIIRG